jgi:hypothetical protein
MKLEEEILAEIVAYHLSPDGRSEHYRHPTTGGMYEHKLANRLGHFKQDKPTSEFMAAVEVLEAHGLIERLVRKEGYQYLGVRPTPSGIAQASQAPSVNEAVRDDSPMDRKYEYDVALSFAGEDRTHAEELADLLDHADVAVFYDAYEKATLWGEDLFVHLHEVYSQKARYVVMFTSIHYRDKVWTNHERCAAQERAINEKGTSYILPVKIDDTPIPGLPTTVGYLSIKEGIPEIARLVLEKLGQSASALSDIEDEVDSLPPGLDEQAAIVLSRACERIVEDGQLRGHVSEGENFLVDADPPVSAEHCREAIELLEEFGYVSGKPTLSGTWVAFSVTPNGFIANAEVAWVDFHERHDRLARKIVEVTRKKSSYLKNIAETLGEDLVFCTMVTWQLMNLDRVKGDWMNGSELTVYAPSPSLKRDYGDE